MQVFVATSLDLINWLLGLFGSSKKKIHISDHNNRIDESLSLPLCILLTIVIGLVLLHLYRFGENKEIISNANEVEEEELQHPVDESDRDFVWDWQLSPRTSEHGGVAKRNTPCAFCGDPSTTRCARCKVARYCSAECQIGHWRSWHKYECFEMETEEGHSRDGTPMLVGGKYDNESILNGSLSSNVGVDESSSSSSSSDAYDSHIGCVECGSPSTTRCSRCKSVRYCSTKCLITNWRWHKYNCIARDVTSAPTEKPNINVGVLKHSNKEESIPSSKPLYLELRPEGASNFKSPSEVSQVTSKECHVHKTQWVKYLEDEVMKSRQETFTIKSERDKWMKRANFARAVLKSFKKESANQLSVLRNENESISNAEKKASNVTHSLHERLNNLQIAAQENFAEKRRLEEHIQTVENECSTLKKELQEEHKHAQYLTLESKKSHETAQIAIREVEVVRQELLEERKHIERVKENFKREITFVESRAIFAEAKLSDLQRKIKLTDHKVLVKTDSLGNPSTACTICLTNEKNMAFGCGHMTCRDCGSQLSKCPICREQITSHIKLFPG